MKGFRRVATLLLIPLLVALMAAPVAAAPGNGAPKTNEEHQAWLVLDPIAASTDDAQVTLSGRVAGNFDMVVSNGAFSTKSEAKGKFSVQVPLAYGSNSITISGVDRAGRLLNAQVQVLRTGEARDVRATELYLEVGQVTLVADGRSTMQIRVAVLDQEGGVLPTYTSPITLASSNPAAVAVLTPTVVPQNGIATATLQGGTVLETATITASAQGLPPVSAAVTPKPPQAGRIAVKANPASLPADGSSVTTLTLTVVDSTGTPVPALLEPLIVQLTSSRPDVARFSSGGAVMEFRMSTPTTTIQVIAGTVAGSAAIAGAAVRPDGIAVPAETIWITTIK